MDIKTKRENRIRRHKRIRAAVKGTSKRPRLCVFRSGKHIYAQLVDDDKGITFVSVNDIKNKASKKGVDVARKTGEELAKRALEKGIGVAVFDRDGYKYHGRVKALADGARQGGLKF